MSEKLLEVKNLRVSYHTYAGEVQSVRGVSFTVNKGETVAVVGESGCGKSVTAKSIMRLIKTPPAEIKEGSEIIFDGEDVLQFNEKRLCAYRGGEVAMVFQDALAALNPTMTVGNQIIENLRHHTKLSKKEAKARAVELLRMVGIPQPESRVDQYPHEFSGGMRQRVMIAIAFACDPKLLIADEPTTALDDHSGPDHRPHQGAAERKERLGHPHHPRPGRCGQYRGPHRGHVRRPDRGAGHQH